VSQNAAPQWEYEVVSMSEQLGESGTKTALNDLGGEGWELVGIHADAAGCPRYVFKRQVGGASPATGAPPAAGMDLLASMMPAAGLMSFPGMAPVAAADSLDPEQERWLRNVSMAEALLSLPEEKRERVFAEVLTDEERMNPSPPDDFYDRVLRYFAQHKGET
jgi:hypothetical protein